METPRVNLRFELSELLALQLLARKFNTDLGGIIRIGALALLTLDQMGVLKMERVVEGITKHLSGGDHVQ